MKFYLVGGAVRDKLLGLNIRDKDWVVIGSTYKEMVNLGFKPVGNNFPVFIHPVTNEEYSLARTEKKSGKGYKGFICSFSKKVSLREDLWRRDLTMNAIAMDKYGNYYDPYGGINDIKKRIIRHVSSFFIDDPLRILRVAQFYSRFFKFGFIIDKKTLELMINISISNELIYLTPERIWIETEKVLKNYNVFLYFYTLYKCKALKFIFPEFKNIFNNIKIKNYFYLIFNKTYEYNFGIEINFICLCFFFYKTILSKDFFFNKNILINKVINFCKRLHIKKLFFNIFILSYNFICKFFFYNGENISVFLVDILYILDVWRKPFIINIILKLINILYILPFNNKYLLYIFYNYFLDIFYITNNIKNKYIIKLGFSGINIKYKLYDLRVKKINYFILNK